ncbi:MAG: caspase family protein [Pseudomonadota bacterium]
MKHETLKTNLFVRNEGICATVCYITLRAATIVGYLQRLVALLVLCLFVPFGGTVVEAGLVINAHNQISYASKGRHALVIGNSNYDSVEPLRNPETDAQDMAAALRRLGFDVTLLIDANRNVWTEGMKAFGEKAQGAETALVYYAGHGIQVGGKNFLLPADAKIDSPEDLPFESFDLEFILRAMPADIGTGILFLDACRNNPLTGAFEGRTRGIALASEDEATEQRPDGPSRTRGLGRVEPKPGLLISFATAPGTVAYDGSGRNSPFTAALLNHIETPGLEVSAMLRRVRKEVADLTKGSQIPWVTSSLSDPFYFNQQSEVPTANAEPLASIAWSAMAKDPSPVVLANFIATYPDSPFATIARKRLEEISANQKQPVDASDLIPLDIEPLDTIMSTDQAGGTVVYDVPDGSGKVLAELAPATEVEVTGQVRQQGWYRVRLSTGKAGYVEKRLMRQVESQAVAVETESIAVAESDSFIRVDTLLRARRTAIVRSVPSQDSNRIFFVPTRREVEVIGISKNKTWCMVRDDSRRTGYVLTSMLEDLDGSAPVFRNLTAMPEQSAGARKEKSNYELIEGLMIANADVAIRQKPDPSSEQIRELRQGDQIYARARTANSDWAIVQLEENTSGYVYLKRLDSVSDDTFFRGLAGAIFANVWYAIGALLLAMLGFGLDRLRRRFRISAQD